jgi:hypothetical protein
MALLKAVYENLSDSKKELLELFKDDISTLKRLEDQISLSLEFLCSFVESKRPTSRKIKEFRVKYNIFRDEKHKETIENYLITNTRKSKNISKLVNQSTKIITDTSIDNSLQNDFDKIDTIFDCLYKEVGGNDKKITGYLERHIEDTIEELLLWIEKARPQSRKVKEFRFKYNIFKDEEDRIQTKKYLESNKEIIEKKRATIINPNYDPNIIKKDKIGYSERFLSNIDNREVIDNELLITPSSRYPMERKSIISDLNSSRFSKFKEISPETLDEWTQTFLQKNGLKEIPRYSNKNPINEAARIMESKKDKVKKESLKINKNDKNDKNIEKVNKELEDEFEVSTNDE